MEVVVEEAVAGEVAIVAQAHRHLVLLQEVAAILQVLHHEVVEVPTALADRRVEAHHHVLVVEEEVAVRQVVEEDKAIETQVNLG